MRIDPKVLMGLDGTATLAELFGIAKPLLDQLFDEASFLLEDGVCDRARERLEAFVGLNSKSPEAWRLLARAYEALGDSSDAAQAKGLAVRAEALSLHR
jgi:predicted Zn-dependent protease